MKELYCVICGKYRKFGKHKISYLLQKTVLYVMNEGEKYLKKKNQLKY